MRRFTILLLLFCFMSAVAAVQAAAESKNEGAVWRTEESAETPGEMGIPEFFVAPPPFSDGIFPCSDCHADMEVNTSRRELVEFHEDIQIINHNEEDRWCLDCHNPDDRDVLRLASGRLVSFEESYYLCGQCHGTIFRDWKAGVHGRRTGEWNGQKVYRLCVHCHNPHQPRFKPLAPKPPPVKPKDIR
ncbi:MAG: hypothetical protein JSV00_07655 [bacterium]|nr:MAG: hypothetical protein JSV00_07655 [bacterium]